MAARSSNILRNPVVDRVSRRFGARGLEAMGVLPERERTGSLDVAELLVGDVVDVVGDPERSEATGPETHDQPGAVLDAAMFLDHTDVLPRRRQALKRARAGVPPEDLGCRRGELAPPHECLGSRRCRRPHCSVLMGVAPAS